MSGGETSRTEPGLGLDAATQEALRRALVEPAA